jgi:hypothetical protein
MWHKKLKSIEKKLESNIHGVSPGTDYEIVKMQNQLSHIMGKTLVDFKRFYSNE